MANNLETIVGEFEKNTTSNKDQKEYAKQLLTKAREKGISKLEINVNTREQINFLLKDASIDTETAVSQISDGIVQTPTPTEALKTTVTEVVQTGYTEGYISKEDKDSIEAGKNAEQIRSQGWTDLYVIAKMISLGYIPKLHDGKYHSSFKGQKIKYVWENANYMLVGGPITNGTINNEAFRKAQNNANEAILKLLFNEKSQTKILLGQVRNSNLNGVDRTNLNNRLASLERMKTALQSGNPANIRTAMADYKQIAETSGAKIKDLFKKENFKTLRAKNETEINKSVSDKIEKSKKNTEKAKTDIKKSITASLDTEIKTIDTEIKRLNGAENDRKISLEAEIKVLEEQKISIEELNKKLTEKEKALDVLKAKRLEVINGLNTISTILGPNGEIIPSSPSILKGQLDIDILAKESEIAKLESEITTTKTHNSSIDQEIKAKNKEIGLNKISSHLKLLEDKKVLISEMKKDISNGNIKSFRNNMIDFESANGSKISGIRDTQLSYLETDHTKKIDKKEQTLKTKAIADKKQEIKQKIQTRRENVPQKEIDRINREIGETERQMTKLRQEAETKLRQFNRIAKENPERVPAMKQEAERLVENYNKQVSKLETAGVENIKGLNSEQLKGVANQSPLLENISKANGGLDKFSSGVGGKFLGVGAMMIVGGGAYSALKKDGLSQETALNATDIGIGMIPIAGGVYDIGMAIHGEDLNGKTMATNERLMRAGFGVVGLVPGLGTAVKWRAASGKIAKTAEGTSKVMRSGEVIIQGGHLAGKTMSLGALGMTVGFTTYEMLPGNEK